MASSITVPGNFAIGALESALMRWGVPTVTVRRWATGGANLACSICMLLFALARTPRQGFAAYFGWQTFRLLHNAGKFPNYLEVGGEDTAILSSVCNGIAQAPAFIVPALALWLRRRTGSWLPQYAYVAALQFCCGLLWLRNCSCTPAREQLAEMRKAEPEPKAQS